MRVPIKPAASARLTISDMDFVIPAPVVIPAKAGMTTGAGMTYDLIWTAMI